MISEMRTLSTMQSSGNAEDPKKNHREPEFIGQLSALTYMQLVTCFGLVVPLASALMYEDDHRHHPWVASFYIYLFVVAIAFLIYFLAYLKRICEMEQQKSDHQHSNSQRSSNSTQKLVEGTAETPIHSTADGHSGNNGNVYSIPEEDAAKVDQSSTSAQILQMEEGDEVKERSSSVSPNLWEEIRSNISKHGEASVYLRLGAFGFGMGTCLHSILMVVQYSQDPACRSYLHIASHTLQFIFTFLQTFFIFKNSAVVITCQRTISRLGLTHLIATNLALWLKILIEETSETFVEYQKEQDEKHENKTETESSINTTEEHIATCDNSVFDTAETYLYPLMVEYTLICAAIAYHVLSRVPSSIQSTRLSSNHSKEEYVAMTHDKQLERDAAKSLALHHHQYQRPVVFHKSNKGLFFGVLVLLGTIVSIVLYYADKNNTTISNAYYIFMITDVLLIFLVLITIIITWILTIDFTIEPVTSQLDDMLLAVGCVGNLLHHISTLLSVVVYSHKVDQSHHLPGQRELTGLAYSAGIIVALLQSVFIWRGLRMKASPTAAKEGKGRGGIMFLLFVNIALWIVDLLELKQILLDDIQIEVYGFQGWALIVHVAVPLSIFFHFHSTVCLADIWQEAYSKPHGE